MLSRIFVWGLVDNINYNFQKHMKYLMYGMPLAIVVTAAVSLVSCTEDQTAMSIEDIQGKARLVGYFNYYDGQQSATGTDDSYKPAYSRTVYVKVENSSFARPNGQYEGYTIYETTTNSMGRYEVEIPADPDGVSVVIEAEPFIGDYYRVEYDDDYNMIITRSEGVYDVQPITRSGIMPNDIVVVGERSYQFTPFQESSY